MAGPERFELPTSSFEDLLSIQLNYGPIFVPKVLLTRDSTITTSLMGGRLHLLYNDQNSLAEGTGIEPVMTESKSVVLPLH